MAADCDAWTSDVQLHLGAPKACADRVRRRFTPRGFQYFDAGSFPDLSEQYSRFAAYHTSHFDAHFAGLVDDVMKPRALGSVAIARIKDFVGVDRGELLYEFLVYKDTIGEVCQRLLDVLRKAMHIEFGSQWRSVEWPRDVLFVRVQSALGGAFNHVFDLTTVLLQDGVIRYEEIFLPVVSRIWDGLEEDERTSRIDCSQFADFTADLIEAHRLCEPDAFGYRCGGKHAKVKIHGLQSRKDLNDQQGVVIAPVDMETKRWPVKVEGSSKPVWVRRSNLSLRDGDSDGSGEEEPQSMITVPDDPTRRATFDAATLMAMQECESESTV